MYDEQGSGFDGRNTEGGDDGTLGACSPSVPWRRRRE
jgi:hypothetical protein